MTNPNNIKRNMGLITGISLILMAIFAGIAYGYIFQNIYVANDSAVTLLNLKQSPNLFRIFIFLFVLILLLDVLVSWSLYYFFRGDNEHFSLLTSFLRLIYTSLLGVSFLSLVNVLQLIKRTPQNATLVFDHLNSFLDIWSLGLIVFGFHLFFLGYLIFTSGDIPKFLGILTLIASLAYICTSSANLLIPDYDYYKPTVEMVLGLPMALGELGIAIWMILKSK